MYCYDINNKQEELKYKLMFHIYRETNLNIGISSAVKVQPYHDGDQLGIHFHSASAGKIMLKIFLEH